MLVIISDLHLTDGTCGETVPTDAFYTFIHQLRLMAYNASWRSDGRYRPLQRLDLLLLGDVLDLIHSTLWLEEADGTPVDVRPWHDLHAPEVVARVKHITLRVLEHNAEGVNILRRLVQEGLLTLPPADRFGRPSRDARARRVPVEVRIYYMVGNHDWLLHLPGTDYDPIRTLVIQALGLSNPPSVFAHGPGEDPALDALLASYHLLARHGDQFDPFNYHAPTGRDGPSLGDVFAIELTNRFPLEVRRQMGSTLPVGFYNSMRRLVNVRPPLAAPLWILEQARRHTRSRPLEEQVKAIWNAMGERFLTLDVLQRFSHGRLVDVAGMLRSAILFSRVMPFSTIAGLLTWMHRYLGDGVPSLAAMARREARQGYRFVVYGHTHHHEVLPLDVQRRGGKDIQPVYANAGTWHAFYNLSQYNLQKRKFVPNTEMTFLALYRDDERGGRRLEAWNGTLF